MFDVKHVQSFCGGRDNLLSSRARVLPVARLVGVAAVAGVVWRSLRAMCSNFRGVVCNAEGSLLRSFCGAQTVCLAVACEYLGGLCVLCVVKRRRSRVCAVCAVCLSAQRSSPALYVLCRAMLESGRVSIG